MTSTHTKQRTASGHGSSSKTRFSIALVGGGPNALYCVERLLAQVLHAPDLAGQLALSVIDLRGAFGAGCHYPTQPTTNHLNRIASQISFCADESNAGQVSALLPKHLRTTLFSWCADRYAKTKSERYEVSEREWVDRSLFGEASCDVFNTYVDELQACGVIVETIKDRVTGMRPKGSGYTLTFQSARAAQYFDAAVLCTGHTEATPQPGERSHRLAEHAKADKAARYIHDVYPIEGIDAEAVAPGSTVICRGFGLAAIDVMLRLTEGRGGYFVPSSDAVRPLRYIRSGFEPERIVPFSSTGVFLFARAYNEKLNDGDLFETGRFFTPEAIDQLRTTVGRPGPTKPQLDFGRHVLPLMVLEMQRIYYETLFGKPCFAQILPRVQHASDAFVAGGAAEFASDADALAALTSIATDHYTALAERLETALAKDAEPDASDMAALLSFCGTYSGMPRAALSGKVANLRTLLKQPSPYLHAPMPSAHIFEWQRIYDPLCDFAKADRSRLGTAAQAFFLKDLADATQGNISNPRKAAIDGVWRDMRDTVRYCVEFGGLLPQSQDYFMHNVHRITNRIAVGTSLKMMTKIMALVDAGVVDMSFGRAPDVSLVDGGFALSRPPGSDTAMGQVLINAGVHRFNLGQTEDSLYLSLLEDGQIREWCIRAGDSSEPSFATGGVEVDPETNLVIKRDGQLNTRLGLLGAPSEGPLYFHLAAVRPYCSDPVIADADKVIQALLRTLDATARPLAHTVKTEIS